MKTAHIICGAAYGDEGKGLFVDYWANASSADYVVRFNSSAQCGHTVVCPITNRRHVFSHFGSGTMSGIPTVWGSGCVINPFVFQLEREHLLAKGIVPVINMHSLCKVTTPFDMLLNRAIETIRTDRHGSCGIGFGETIERHERGVAPILLYDLLHSDWMSNVPDLRSYFRHRIAEEFPDMSRLDVDAIAARYNVDNNQSFGLYVDAVQYLLDHINVIDSYDKLNGCNLVFEGGQGLLLSQTNRKDFPHLTRSDTGISNAIRIINTLDDTITVNVSYITRHYTTRHGAGPLLDEQPFPEYLADKDLTNTTGEYQGRLRYAPLNVDLLLQTIQSDWYNTIHLSYIHALAPLKIGVTWLDLYNGDPTSLLTQLSKESDVYVSNGPTRHTISKFNPL
jgi:adenylosuccinate synthase